MKKLFIKLFGKDTYCNWFHTGVGVEGKSHYYHCSKCRRTYFAIPDTGVR